MTTAPPLPPPTVETRFGTFPVAAADVVHFAHGLPGFESCRQFVLITAPELLPFTCLHGIDAPGPSFLTLDPRQIVAGYTSPLGAAERHRLEAAPEEPLLWLAIYEDDYRKVDGVWKIAYCKLNFLWPERAWTGLRHP